jgi:hypothetical protein
MVKCEATRIFLGMHAKQCDIPIYSHQIESVILPQQNMTVKLEGEVSAKTMLADPSLL